MSRFDVRIGNVARPLFSTGCVALLTWFYVANPWNNYFASPGPLLLYNAARLAYAMFLAVALIGTGRLLLRALGDRNKTPLSPRDQVFLSFCAGAGVLIPLLFAANAAGLLYWWLAAPLFVVALWHGYPVAAASLSAAVATVARWREIRRFEQICLAALYHKAACAPGLQPRPRPIIVPSTVR